MVGKTSRQREALPWLARRALGGRGRLCYGMRTQPHSWGSHTRLRGQIGFGKWVVPIVGLGVSGSGWCSSLPSGVLPAGNR